MDPVYVQMLWIRRVSVSLPRMLDRLRRVLSGYDPVGWLGLPMDFMNSTGVLRPIEECGRT